MENIIKNFLSILLRTLALFSPKLCASFSWSFFCKPRIRKKPVSKTEQALLQQANHLFVTSGDYEVAIYQWKNATGNGKTVLLTHGWGGHALNFSLIIKSLLANGFNVLAFDGPAHGNSSGKTTTLIHNANAVLAVAKQAQPIHALIGHSFGTISNAYAYDLASNSELFSQLEHMIIIAGPNKLKNIFASFTGSMCLPPKILSIFIDRVEKLTGRNMSQMTTVDFLQTYCRNILVLHDKQDPVVPHSEAHDVSKGTGARLFTTTGCGHGRILITQSIVDEIENTLTHSTPAT